SVTGPVPGGDSVIVCGADVVPTETSPNTTGSSLTTTTFWYVDEKCGVAIRHDARAAAMTIHAETRRFTIPRIAAGFRGVNAWVMALHLSESSREFRDRIARSWRARDRRATERVHTLCSNVRPDEQHQRRQIRFAIRFERYNSSSVSGVPDHTAR